MRFYTWKDIERYVLSNYKEWKDALYNIEVYPDEIILYPRDENSIIGQKILTVLFPKNINIVDSQVSIKLDCSEVLLPVSYCYEETNTSFATLPLFKRA